jgi:hypothetical protein
MARRKKKPDFRYEVLAVLVLVGGGLVYFSVNHGYVYDFLLKTNFLELQLKGSPGAKQ